MRNTRKLCHIYAGRVFIDSITANTAAVEAHPPSHPPSHPPPHPFNDDTPLHPLNDHANRNAHDPTHQSHYTTPCPLASTRACSRYA